MAAEVTARLKVVNYSVPGIHCAHCSEAISDEVRKIAGVDGVDVDIDGKVVSVRGAGVSDADVRRAIVDAGYEAVA